MLVRRGTRDDSFEIASLIVTGWQWAHRDILPDDYLASLNTEQRAARLRESWQDENLILVAMSDEGFIVGFASEAKPPQLDGYDVELGAIYVRQEHSRKGHGRRLLARMTEEFHLRGAGSMALHTLRDNRIARSFYEKLGGAVVTEDWWRDYPAVWYGWPSLARLRDELARSAVEHH